MRRGTVFFAAMATAVVAAVLAWTLLRERPGARVDATTPTADRAAAASPPAPAAPTLAQVPPDETEIAALRRRIEDLERRLAERDAPTTAAPRAEPVPGSPGEARALLDAMKERKARLTALLLTPPASVSTRFANLLAKPDTGVARILHRGRYEDAVEPRGGGAYYSFATRDGSYDKEPDLEYEGGKFASGFYGSNWGHVMDLGAIAIETVPDSPSGWPPGLDPKERETWDAMWSDGATEGQRQNPQFRNGGLEDRIPRNRVDSVLGHTYLLRAFLVGEHDLLAAFSPVDEDEHGQTIVWRILRSWPVASRRAR